MKKVLTGLALAFPLAAQAQDTTVQDDFVSANVLSIFYHELGHALIDVMELPVFGQEEDAADVASILLINEVFDEQAAQDIARDAAWGFLGEAELSDGLENPWWSEHGPDLQRFYNLVCLFYGANPELRDDFAEDMGLPEERAERCPDEYDLAISSWGPVFDDLYDGKDKGRFIFSTDTPGVLSDTVSQEVTALNAEIALPIALDVEVASCGEANAFYDPEAKQITMCTEFEPHLRAMEQRIGD